jgi:prepilin-type N-terminal cleavage/methylation domain-containing protein
MKTLSKKHLSGLSGNQHGFTLVEMSVVLLVIGLILGAVSIGKDIQRDAEYMKIKQKFIDQWASAYNDYYLRTGVVLADSQTAPRFMVNGKSFGPTPPSGGSVISGGDMTGTTGASTELCDQPLMDEMDRTGVRMPPGRAEGHEDRYVYLDSNGNPQELKVCFRWNPPDTWSGSGNVMVIHGLTPDLARTLDQEIDGKPDAQEGMFRQDTVANGNPGEPGVEWAGNNTDGAPSFSPAVPCSGGSSAPVAQADNKDEDQVCTYVADYKMNQ